ncbi:MAG: hypothetical protein ACNA7U_03090 [Candidatus Izemoplasmataceae bacterium]
MDKTNKDYNALKELVLHIHEATALQINIDKKNEQINDLKQVNIDFNHPEFPYYKAKNTLEETIQKTTILKVITAMVLNSTIGIIFASIPLIISYNLATNDIIAPGNERLFIIGSIILGVIIFVVLMLVIPKKLWTLQTKIKRIILVKKSEPKIEQAKEAAIKLVEAYHGKIQDKIVMLQKGIKLDEKELSKHQQKIEKSTILHQKYYKHIDLIFDYFDTNRAETVKEAINLLENERKQDFYFERLLYALKHKDLTVDQLKDSEFNINEKLLEIQKEKELTQVSLSDLELEKSETHLDETLISEVLESQENELGNLDKDESIQLEEDPQEPDIKPISEENEIVKEEVPKTKKKPPKKATDKPKVQNEEDLKS